MSNIKFDFKYCIASVNFVLSILSLFLVVPIAMIGHDPTSFDFINKTYLLQVGISSSIALAMCLIPLYILSIYFQNNKILLFCSIFVISWISIAGYIAPVIESSAMKDVFETTIDCSNLLIVALVSLLAACLYKTKLYIIPTVFGLVIAVSSLVSSLPDAIQIQDTKKLNVSRWDEVATLSKGKNIIVLSFDGVPGNVVLEVLKDLPQLSNDFKDFICYKKVISAAPATQASIRGELFGVRSFRELGNNDAEVEKNLELGDLLINRHDNVFTYGVYNNFNLDDKTKQIKRKTIHTQLYDHRNFRDLIITRVATYYGFRLLQKLKLISLGDSIDAYVFANTRRNIGLDSFDNWSLSYSGPYWKLKLLIDAKYYNIFLSKLNSDGDGAVVRMLHFAHTHFPVDFDNKCSFRSSDSAWHEDNQNHEGLYNEVICDLSEFSRFIRKLREIGAYRNALIVLKSDHGKPVPYFSAPPQNLEINGNPQWGYNRYQPLLMIKPPGRVSNTLSFVEGEYLVSLADLAKTLCLNCGLPDMDCGMFPGIDLLGDIDSQVAGNEYLFIDVASDFDSSYRYEDHKTIKIHRRADSLIDALRVVEDLTLSSRTDIEN